MIMLVMTALFIGALLGLRFKAFILVPAVVIGATTILGIGMARGDSIWPTLLAAVLVITALQIGYLCGAVVHFSIAKPRARKDSATIIAVVQRTPF